MRFKRKLQARHELNLVPMIDVLLLLVLFFMVSSTFAVLPGIALKLPQSSSAEPTTLARLSVSVVSRDEIYLNRDRLDLKGLEAALAGLGADKKAEIKSVTLDADASVPYGLTVEVLDALRRGGFRNINLHTLER